jgi:hypothetical protein
VDRTISIPRVIDEPRRRIPSQADNATYFVHGTLPIKFAERRMSLGEFGKPIPSETLSQRHG